MAQLQITIEIADTPVAGHALNKLKKYGTAEASVIDRIGRANSATFPDHKYRPTEILIQAIAAAVIVAEAEE